MTNGERAHRALNRVAKWRTLFAGWQLGTRAKGDPESDAVRDHRELSILLRVENSALVALLIEKGVFTLDEWAAQLVVEAEALNETYERQFPGVTAREDGLTLDPSRIVTEGWMAGWKP